MLCVRVSVTHAECVCVAASRKLIQFTLFKWQLNTNNMPMRIYKR